MNLIDAIRLYTHVLQTYGGGYEARQHANTALKEQNVARSIREAIANSISNEGNLTSARGAKFAITQLSSS